MPRPFSEKNVEGHSVPKSKITYIILKLKCDHNLEKNIKISTTTTIYIQMSMQGFSRSKIFFYCIC